MCKEFKCPVCGAINAQKYIDSLDEGFYDNELIVEYLGYCGECETELRWEETYILSSYDNIKVMKG